MPQSRLLQAVAVLTVLCAAVFLWRAQPPPGTAPRTRQPEQGPATNAPAPSPSTKAAAPSGAPVVTTPAPAPARGGSSVVVKGGWGAGPSQFGRKRDPESNPEGPMAIVAGAHGELAVVDQINHRVTRFGPDGKPAQVIQLGGDTAQDLAFGKGGSTAVLDRLGDKNVQVYGPDGKLVNEVPLEGKGVPEGGGVTGLFSDDDGLYVEREHAQVVRVADASGRADAARPELQGRPSRDGRLLLGAIVVDRAQGDVVVRAADRQTGQERWQRGLRLGTPIVHLLLLDSDRQGNVYVAVDVGREGAAPPYQIVDEKIVVERLSGGGELRGAIELPALPATEEAFRPISVDDDGNVYVMAAAEGGLTVTRYSFP